MHTLRMLSYDQSPDEHFLYVTEDANVAHAVSCVKDYPHKRFKLAQVNHKQNIFTKTKTYHFRGRLWYKSYRTIVAGTQQMDGTWKHLKNGDLRRCSTKKKNQNVYKKVHLGLQLDMASQRCLVADCGFCVATSALAPLASRRGKNWKSECRPDMIRMIENYKFLMFFLDPCESRRGRNAHFHFWVTRLPIEMNAHVANIFWRLLQIPAFCLLASKIRISNSSPLQGCRVNWLPCFSQFPISLIWTLSRQQESQADPAPTEAAMAPKLLRMVFRLVWVSPSCCTPHSSSWQELASRGEQVEPPEGKVNREFLMQTSFFGTSICL